MSVPPGEHEYPVIECPNCGNRYSLPDLDIEDGDPPSYNCPNCQSEVYEPESE